MDNASDNGVFCVSSLVMCSGINPKFVWMYAEFPSIAGSSKTFWASILNEVSIGTYLHFSSGYN